MDKRAKLIIVGLIGFVLISLFLFIQASGSKQQLARERDELQKENDSLNSKISKIQKGLREYENKINALNTALESALREKQEIEKKHELVKKEREELAEKLRRQPQQSQASAGLAQPQALSSETDAYWAGILKAKTDLEMQLDKARAELKTALINSEEANREKAGLELDLKNLKILKEDLSRQLDYNQKVMDSIAQELVRERNDKIQIENSLKFLKNENGVLVRQLKGLNNRKVNLERKLQEVQEEKNTVEDRFSEMQAMLTDRISEVNKLKDQLDSISSGSKIENLQSESVELPPIVVRPREETVGPIAEEPAAESAGGKIMAVNEENNFVVVDLGEDAGIKLGDTFQVYRGRNSIAALTVIKVSKSVSACDINKQIAPLKIGDTVK